MKQPLFKKIQDFIKQQIVEQKYLPNTKIPTETEFAKMFKTSRQTVNKALRDLVLEGLVERFPRSGTFVKQKIAQTSILELKNIAVEVQQRGNLYSCELLKLQEIKADDMVANIMNLVKDQKVYMSEMIHKENGVPVRFDIRYVKPSLVPDYLKQDFDTITPSLYLQRFCPVEQVSNVIEAVLANDMLLKYLEISRDEPCLLISRIVTSQKQIASYSKLFYPSSRYKLTSTFKSD